MEGTWGLPQWLLGLPAAWGDGAADGAAEWLLCVSCFRATKRHQRGIEEIACKHQGTRLMAAPKKCKLLRALLVGCVPDNASAWRRSDQAAGEGGTERLA